MNEKYELDYGRSEENGHHEEIAILTGHSIEDIIAASSLKSIWHTSDYILAFQKLGFNCDTRFVKFDPKTDKPCMMRFTRKDIKDNYWYSHVYYNDKVYFGRGEWCRFDDFRELNPEIRITSMLRVWL